jgi:flavorubredoxin
VNQASGLVRQGSAADELPRAISPNLLWTGGCVGMTYRGRQVHGHFSVYLVKGSGKTMLIDAGHPMHWPALERDVEAFLAGRPLDYVFATHGEFPHIGCLPHWLRKYPDAIAVGEVGDYDLYYPDLADRLAPSKAGESFDLGDRQVVCVPAIWRDIPTLWAFETSERVLFVSDAFAYLHYHEVGQCSLRTSEHPPPDLDMIRFFNERALVWTRYTDPEESFGDMDRLLGMLRPRLIAPAHGGIVDTVETMLPLMQQGLTSGWA